MLLRLLFLSLAVAAAAPVLAQFGRAELSAGMHRIEAELALNQSGRMLGLMNRKEMAPQHGMLFAFPEPAIQCMWMKNTLIPLSVAFLDEQGRILNIEDMAPQTLNSHCAAAPAAFALEMNQGWFSHRGLKPGDLIRGASAVRPVD